MLIRSLSVVLLAACAWPAGALAHDPSAWGGFFRSRDHGATWLPADEGRFLSGALALAISPRDPSHLLLATDSGLLRTRNGGRDWTTEAPALMIGAVFAVAFDADGERALASTPSGLFRTDDGTTWRRLSPPERAKPARALAAAGEPGRVYLAAPGGLWRSDDWGVTWTGASEDLEGEVEAVLVDARRGDTLYAIASGRVWRSTDGARTWQPRDVGLPENHVEAVAQDPRDSSRLWAAGADRVFRSDDAGRGWRPAGQPLSEPGAAVRGLSVLDRSMVLTTHRGLLRSADGGETWQLMADTLPVHLEAGPLVQDPGNPATLYAGFSVMPYTELWRMATDGGPLLTRLDPVSLAGAAALLLILAGAGWGAVRWLTRADRAPVSAGAGAPRQGRSPRRA